MTDENREWVQIPVAAGTRDQGYRIVIVPGGGRDLWALLGRWAPAERYVVVSDANVAGLYGSMIEAGLSAGGRRVDVITFPPGEASKCRAEWARLSDAMMQLGVGRDAVVVAVGGGVTGDLAGFVAATYMRGLPVVQVPTTLLAMIDASVGGKTGVNTKHGKNLVGSFHPPTLVVVDPDFVATLSATQRSEGLAEALKHGAILDEAHLRALEARAGPLLEGEPASTGWAVERSIRIKADVVGRDERESGLREILNFGHTLGHAFEAASGYRMSHGASVAIGMVFEAALGERLGVTAPGTSAHLSEAVARIGLGVTPSVPLNAASVVATILKDKKGRGARPRFVLLERLGRVAREGSEWSRPVPDELVAELVARACDGRSPI